MKVSDIVVGENVSGTRLTIISVSIERNIHGKLMAMCKCECGKEIQATINNIGHSTFSCGCLKSESINHRLGKGPENANVMHVLHDIKRRTPNTDLTYDHIASLIMSDCYYCGKTVEEVGNAGTTYSKLKVKVRKLGIDRVNNNIGYIVGNVVPCCYTCNRVKYNMGIDFILKYFQTISQNAFKLVDGFVPILDGKRSICIEHIDKCTCKTGNYTTSLEDRVIKIAYNRCKFSGHTIDLTISQVGNIIYADRCFYCERTIKEVGSLYKRNGYGKNLCAIRKLGIDRINSALEYTIDNTVACCKDCNHIKSDYAPYDFGITTRNIFDKISYFVSTGGFRYV